jgi:hypothetical protein
MSAAKRSPRGVSMLGMIATGSTLSRRPRSTLVSAEAHSRDVVG